MTKKNILSQHEGKSTQTYLKKGEKQDYSRVPDGMYSNGGKKVAGMSI